jgi:hypothetical protein
MEKGTKEKIRKYCAALMNRNIYHISCNIIQYIKEKRMRKPSKFDDGKSMMLLQQFEIKRLELRALDTEIVAQSNNIKTFHKAYVEPKLVIIDSPGIKSSWNDPPERELFFIYSQ